MVLTKAVFSMFRRTSDREFVVRPIVLSPRVHLYIYRSEINIDRVVYKRPSP